MITKKELEGLKTRALFIKDDGATYYGVEFVLNKLIEEAPESHWHNYPEVKPEKDGNYLIRSVVEPVDEVSSDLYSKDTDSWKYFDTDVIAWCEIPV